MSEEQLTDLLTKLKEDTGLQEKLKGATDLDIAVAIAKEAGFDVSKADWIKYQARKVLEMSNEELEAIAGGRGGLNNANKDEVFKEMFGETTKIFDDLANSIVNP